MAQNTAHNQVQGDIIMEGDENDYSDQEFEE